MAVQLQAFIRLMTFELWSPDRQYYIYVIVRYQSLNNSQPIRGAEVGETVKGLTEEDEIEISGDTMTEVWRCNCKRLSG